MAAPPRRAPGGSSDAGSAGISSDAGSAGISSETGSCGHLLRDGPPRLAHRPGPRSSRFRSCWKVLVEEGCLALGLRRLGIGSRRSGLGGSGRGGLGRLLAGGLGASSPAGSFAGSRSSSAVASSPVAGAAADGASPVRGSREPSTCGCSCDSGKSGSPGRVGGRMPRLPAAGPRRLQRRAGASDRGAAGLRRRGCPSLRNPLWRPTGPLLRGFRVMGKLANRRSGVPSPSGARTFRPLIGLRCQLDPILPPRFAA